MYNNVLIITDNDYLYQHIRNYLNAAHLNINRVDFRYSPVNNEFLNKYGDSLEFKPLNIKKDYKILIDTYDLIFSLHCKQLFPKELVEKVTCINVHPGYNPYNRGWYPHIFSIINGMSAGVTIHLMDAELDHGAIIDQETIKIETWETSDKVYRRILRHEVKLLKRNLKPIIEGQFHAYPPKEEGNINYIKDFQDLCKLDLNKKGTFKEFINQLRALTHGRYNNAYFFDENGNKIYIKINLTKVKPIKKRE
jgi:methionyl-tRNA formyltransferase